MLKALAYSVSDVLLPDFIDKVTAYLPLPENLTKLSSVHWFSEMSFFKFFASRALTDTASSAREKFHLFYDKETTVMMHSRARLLLEREFQEFKNARIFVSLFPSPSTPHPVPLIFMMTK